MTRTKIFTRIIIFLLLPPIFYLLLMQTLPAPSLDNKCSQCFSLKTTNTVLGKPQPINFSEASYLIISIYTDKATYAPGDDVTIFGYVIDSTGAPIQDVTIAIEVRDPNNNTIFLDIVFTNSEGYYNDQFRLHRDSPLGLYYVYATASASGYTPAANMCTFSVEEVGFHDISIIDLEYYPEQPVVNQTLTITVVVANLGNYTETFGLSVNYTMLHDPIIGTKTITLAPKETITINFTWRPNTVGRYLISAYTSKIPEDIDSSNNSVEIIIYVRSRTTGSAGVGTSIRKCFLK